MTNNHQRMFEYIVLHHPKERKDKEGNDITERSKLIQDVQRVLARDEKEVGILAARAIPAEYLDKLETVEIVVRPF